MTRFIYLFFMYTSFDLFLASSIYLPMSMLIAFLPLTQCFVALRHCSCSVVSSPAVTSAVAAAAASTSAVENANLGPQMRLETITT